MSLNNPCAVYNFYNCCDPSAAPESSTFIWQSGNILDPYPQFGSTSTQESLSFVIGIGNVPDADLKTYQGLLPLHRKARLNEISLIRFKESSGSSSPPYTASVMFKLVVLDYAGALIRTISAAPINYQSLPLQTWTPISLSTAPGDLDVPAGQLVAGELAFGAPLATGQWVSFVYQLSGTGVLL